MKRSSCSDCNEEERLPPGFLERYRISDNISDGILIWLEIEIRNGSYSLTDNIKKIIGRSRTSGMGRTFGVLLGNKETESVYNEAFAFGLDTIHHFRSDIFNDFDPERYVISILTISDRIDPKMVVLPKSEKGNISASYLTSIGKDVHECKDITEQQGRFVLMDTSSLPLPDKDEKRKGTVHVHSVRSEQLSLSHYSRIQRDRRP